ncbi:MAG: hypothetical protein K1X75_06060 [Leptospirales bacterium]|nr:hypothetical protein [Leptospirales bacterium]
MKAQIKYLCALLLLLLSAGACTHDDHGPYDFGTKRASDNLLRGFIFFGIYREYIPCDLPDVRYYSPGDSATTSLSPGGGTLSPIFGIGCSANPWSFTVTPSAGIDAYIQLKSCTGFSPGSTVADSGGPGVPESISGPAGCSVGNNAAHYFEAKSGPGTLTVQFN